MCSSNYNAEAEQNGIEISNEAHSMVIFCIIAYVSKITFHIPSS